MKRTLVFSAICVAATALCAQERADIEVSYSASKPNFRTGTADGTNQYILLANSTESKFYSPASEYVDSLCSTPEGDAKYKEMARAAFFGNKFDRMPSRDGSYYVVKSMHNGTMTTYDVNGMEKYRMDEPLAECDWEITDSTLTILGYECQMAKAAYHGREWSAWFTMEIPLSDGPWKLRGLPGLILKAEDQSGLYRFEATGIQQTGKEIGPEYLANDYEKIDRKEFFKARRSFLDNPVSQLNAQLSGTGVSITAQNAPLRYKTRDEIDFIETDY